MTEKMLRLFLKKIKNLKNLTEVRENLKNGVNSTAFKRFPDFRIGSILLEVFAAQGQYHRCLRHQADNINN
jgi:hypothetical protein